MQRLTGVVSEGPAATLGGAFVVQEVPMPYAAMGRCSEPGCSALALPKNHGKCGEHTRASWSTGAPRGATERLGISGSGWQRLRATILRRDDERCQSCGGLGVEVDHIIPVGEGGAKTDPANLQTLCATCHAVKSKAEVSRANARRLAAARLAKQRAAEPPPF